MKLPRRTLLRLAGGAVALPAVARLARAQSYPSRSVLLLVGYAAGGPTDICARLIGDWLSKKLDQQFVVENRAGAGSNIATEAVIHADPDGYTLLLVTSSNAINTTLYTQSQFQFHGDIAPVAGIMQAPSVLEVTPSFPANTIAEFIAYAKAHPGKIDLGTAGNGSPPHMFAELFIMMAGVNFNHGGLSRRRAGAGRSALRPDPGHDRGHHLVDRLHQAPASCARSRSPRPNVRPRCRTCRRSPTPCRVTTPPAGSASARRRRRRNRSSIRLSKAIGEALADPAMQGDASPNSARNRCRCDGEFGKLVADDTEKWAKVIRSANIKVD